MGGGKLWIYEWYGNLKESLFYRCERTEDALNDLELGHLSKED